jgi:UPF0716 family protein affecting phage T7 exclusion
MATFLRGSRVIAESVIGYVLLAAGVVMLITPGPGIVTVVAGLALLARHWRWAERLKGRVLSRIRDTATQLRARRAAHRVHVHPTEAADAAGPEGPRTAPCAEAA